MLGSVPGKCVWMNGEREREREFLTGSQESNCVRSCEVSGVTGKAQGQVVAAAARAAGSQGVSGDKRQASQVV